MMARFPVVVTTPDELADRLLQRMAQSKQSVLLFANTNFIVKCRPLLPRMLNDEVIIVNDGVGMDIAALLLYRRRFKANLNGTDFTPFLITKCSRPLRVFLLGGKLQALDAAARYLDQELGQVVVGSCDGYQGMQQADDLVQVINASEADVLLVATGNPKQEQWILDHYRQLNVKLLSGVGALFDFWAKDKPRAPAWVQRIRMEWLFRLCLEPKRLFKRYTMDILIFLILCFRYRGLKNE
ncbi:MAG TPA: WecB/TagA/CpsF family glycosyltransferase [Methylophilaceae bacterium]|jgi:beta-1,4-glucosyltransferase